MSLVASHIRLSSVRYAGRQRAVGATLQHTSAPPAVGPFWYRWDSAGCGRADGATRRCTTPKAHPAILTQRGLLARSTWEPRSASGSVDQTDSTPGATPRELYGLGAATWAQSLLITTVFFVQSQHEPTPIFLQ
jgi:hypothetical protein